MCLTKIQIPELPLHQPTVNLGRLRGTDSEPGWEFGAMTHGLA